VTLFRARSGRVMRWALRLGLIVSLLLTSVAVLAPVALAQSGPWRGEYYNNVNLSGSPVLVRYEANIDFNWGAGSPGGGVNADNFSVRWTAFINFAAGDYTFSVTTDDGARLWVDDQLLIDQWRDQSATTFSAVKSLSAGYHSLRLEYYENYGDAVIRLSWQTGGTGGDWRAEYYNNTWLGGDPVVVRNEAAINYNWGYGSPAAGVNVDGFSARWTRDAYFPSSGNYTFSVTVDDGVRLWVDGVNIIDKWFPQSPTTYRGYIYLAAGTHQIRVEYFEDTGIAVCQVSWSPSGSAAAVEIIVDDRDAGFIRGGPASGWYGRNYGYREHLFWTWNSRTQVSNWGKWFPYVPTAGNWEVYVYIPSKYFGTKSATYSIYHNGVRHTRVVNQGRYFDQWVSLGTYYFAGGSGEYVYLGDNTGEPYATRYVGFDAVKFVRRDGAAPSPSPVPTPAPPSGCTITPILGFGRIWSTYPGVRSKLGCPTEVEKGVWAAEEVFQNGYMFWRQDTKLIYVLYHNGAWQSFNDTWTSSEPETDPTIVPPPGYYQPKRGFGKVWRENPAVRSGLGWATTEERGFYASVQQFNGGLMLWSNVLGIFVLYGDGRWERYY